MKKITLLALVFCTIIISSCTKKSDISEQYSTVNASVILWDNNTPENYLTKIDSCRFDIYLETGFSPITSVYTNQLGSCGITLQKDIEYYFVCTSPTYKNSSNPLYHYEFAGKFCSCASPNNSLVATFLYDFGGFPNGSATIPSTGSTNFIYSDPINY